jgi:hypothetical protein
MPVCTQRMPGVGLCPISSITCLANEIIVCDSYLVPLYLPELVSPDLYGETEE